MSEQTTLKTPECMLGHFPKLFEQGLPDDRGNKFYETDLLFSPEAQKTAEFAKLKEAAAACAKAEWKDAMPSNLKSPFRPASEKRRQADNTPYYPAEQFPGYVLMRVKSKNKPQIVNAQVQEITDETEVYGGAFVRVSLHPYAYQVKGNAGVSFGLNNVQKMRDGEPLAGGSRTRASDDFEPVGEAAAGDVDALFNA